MRQRAPPTGPATKAAVTSFQQADGLTADGIVGSQTWNRLRQPLNHTGAPCFWVRDATLP